MGNVIQIITAIVGVAAVVITLQVTAKYTAEELDRLAPAVEENTISRVKSVVILEQVGRNMTALNAWQSAEIEKRTAEHAIIDQRLNEIERDLEHGGGG